MMGRKIYNYIIITACCLLVSHGRLWACEGLAKGDVQVQVMSCVRVDFNKYFSNPNELPIWLTEMDAASIKKFLSQYQGSLLRGFVKKSDAVVSTGLMPTKHALVGTEITLFASHLPEQCGKLNGSRLQARLTEMCCDGGGKAPCLLGEKYRLDQVQIMKNYSTGNYKRKDDLSVVTRSSRTSEKGKALFRQGKISDSIQYLRAAQKRNRLDIIGKWMLGRSYEQKNACEQAIVPLASVRQAWLQGETTSEEDKIVGPAILLLARCYAKIAKPNDAVATLDILLKQPQMFREQIRVGLIHSDFNWIRNNTGYLGFKREAIKLLKSSYR